MVVMTIAAVVQRLAWQAKRRKIAAKNQQVPGKVIKIKVGGWIFFFFCDGSLFFRTKMKVYTM